MLLIELGNDNAIEAYRDPTSEEPEKVRYRPLEGQHVTTTYWPDDWDMASVVKGVLDAIPSHFATNAAPAWIETTDIDVRDELMRQLKLPKGATKKPVGWGDPEHPKIEPKKAIRTRKAAKKAATSSTAMLLLLPIMAAVVFFSTRLSLRTTGGRDWQSRVMGDPSSNASGVYASASWMGVTADNAAPNAANTTLAGEITTGTLARKNCGYSHTNGTATYALTAVFVFDQAVTLAKIGIFNANAAGTMVWETMLSAPVIGTNGDQVTITETITL